MASGHPGLGRSFRRDAETGGRDAHPTRDLLPPLWPVILPSWYYTRKSAPIFFPMSRLVAKIVMPRNTIAHTPSAEAT